MAERISIEFHEATKEQLEKALAQAKKGEQARRDLGSFWQAWERRRERLESALSSRRFTPPNQPSSSPVLEEGERP